MLTEAIPPECIVPTSKDPRHEALGRALCALKGIDTPDELIQGVTGRFWTTWDHVALYTGRALLSELEKRGFTIKPL